MIAIVKYVFGKAMSQKSGGLSRNKLEMALLIVSY